MDIQKRKVVLDAKSKISDSDLTDEGKINVMSAIVREKLGLPENCFIEPRLSFTREFGADSLDEVEILMAVEDHYGVDIEMVEGTPGSIDQLKVGLDRALGPVSA